MRRGMLWHGLMLVVALWAAPALAGGLQPEEVRTAAGTRAWLIQDATVPAFTLRITVLGAGSAYDPPGKEGRAALAAAALMEGAGEYDSAAFHDRLDFHAIRLGVSASREDMNISLTSLSEHADVAFALLRVMLQQPRFAEGDVARIRQEHLAGLKQKQGDAGYRAAVRLFAAAFATHPYARPTDGTADSIAALTPSDLRQFSAAHLVRGRFLISLSGDVSPARLERLLADYIDPLVTVDAPPASVPVPAPLAAAQERETLDVPQTVVYFALPGVARESKEYYTAFVMNHLLGGSGLSSRLAKDIREERGLAYYAYSDLMELTHAPLIFGSFATQNDKAGEAVGRLKHVLKAAATEGFSEEEFSEGIAYLTGSFPAKLTSNRTVSQYLDSMQRYGLGKDYLVQRNAYLRRVTLAEVNALAARLLRPEQLVIVTAGGAASAPESK